MLMCTILCLCQMWAHAFDMRHHACTQAYSRARIHICSHLYTPIFTLILTVSHASFCVCCKQWMMSLFTLLTSLFQLTSSYSCHSTDIVAVTWPICGCCHITLNILASMSSGWRRLGLSIIDGA